MADITSKVKEIIVDKLGVDAAEVTPEASFTKDLGADSLDIYQIVNEVEDELQISLEEAEIERITTVGEAVVLIKKAENRK